MSYALCAKIGASVRLFAMTVFLIAASAPARAGGVEWSGALTLPAADYALTVTVEGAEAETVHMTLLPIVDESRSSIRSARRLGHHLFASRPTVGPGGKGIVVRPGTVAYELHTDPGRRRTAFRVTIPVDGTYLLGLARDPGFGPGGHIVLSDPTGRPIAAW